MAMGRCIRRPNIIEFVHIHTGTNDYLRWSVPRKRPRITANDRGRQWSTDYSFSTLGMAASFSLIPTAVTTKAGERGMVGV